MNKRSIIVLFAVMVILFCGCRRQPGADMMRVYELTETAPAQALAALDSINVDKLSEPDRRFYDFLRLKTDDKNYVRHTSDTTILDLVDYYKNDSRFGAEMLYYGGRVYSDLGDYPTALTYFQKALQSTPAEENPRLRCHIASQTGRLLNNIRMRSEAIPYIKESLRLDSLLKDTINLMYNHQLLGTIYLGLNKIDTAEIILNQGNEWAQFLSPEYKAKINTDRARVEYLKGNIDSALLIIRGVPENQQAKFRSKALLYATQIYLANGLEDSAYHYLKILLSEEGNKNRRQGYSLLLNSNLSKLIPQDSILAYINKYNQVVTDYFNNYESEAALYQNSFYNYNSQVLRRVEAESDLKTQVIVTTFCLILLLLAISFLLYFKYKNVHNIIKLRDAIDRVEYLRRELLIEKNSKEELQNQMSLLTQTKAESFKEKLLSHLMVLNNEGSKGVVNPDILQSEPYKYLKKNEADKHPVREEDTVWAKLEDVINNYNPNFAKNLSILFDGPITIIERQTIMLLKCGFTSSEIAIITGRGKSAISIRCKKIGSKIFGAELDLSTLENIIRLL